MSKRRKKQRSAAARPRQSAPSGARASKKSKPAKPALSAWSPRGAGAKTLSVTTTSVAALRRELDEARAQQTATADVLKVISRSTFDLQAVFNTLVESAARLCEADMASIHRPSGKGYDRVASHGFPAELDAFMKDRVVEPGRGSTLGRVLLERKIVHIPDVLADPDYTFLQAQKIAGFRTILGVPLLRDGTPIGVIVLQRKSVRPFTDKHIELVKTFADQAVIAIENVRLFEAEQARTEELSESLQQQTATADVLKVISRSTFDLQTVLDTLTESAAHLCDADHAWIFRRDGETYRWAASFGHSKDEHEGIKEFFKGVRVSPGRETLVGRTALEGRPVHIADCFADPEYKWPEAQKVGHYRTNFGVPLLREGVTIGVLCLTRAQVRPFTDKQIELATTFADQAVIAIENVRLFDEVQARTRDLSEALEQQTATSEVLRAISSSPGELEPVFTAMLENATRICDAKFGMLWLSEGDGFRVVAMHGLPPALSGAREQEPIIRPGPEIVGSPGTELEFAL